MRIKHFTLLLLLLLVANISTAQITGAASGYDQVSVIGNIELTLEQAEDGGFDGTVENCTESALSWSIKKNRLEFRLADNFTFLKKGDDKPKAKITLKYSNLSAIIANNGALICNKDVLKGTILSVDLGAQSTVVLNVDVADIALTASNSTATLTGKTEFGSIKASSGSAINSTNMESEMMSVSSLTNSECYVNSSRKLEAIAATGAKVYYKGNPYIFMPTTTTFGKIEKL